MQKYTISTLFLMLVTISALAEDCDYIENYTPNLSYQEYDVVQRKGKVFECKVAGWCNQGGPYTPDIGRAWQQAWVGLGYCHQNPDSPDVSYREFCIGQDYAVGDIVANRGYLYECKIEGWCSNTSQAYEPGVGRAWFDAWKPVRFD